MLFLAARSEPQLIRVRGVLFIHRGVGEMRFHRRPLQPPCFDALRPSARVALEELRAFAARQTEADKVKLDRWLRSRPLDRLDAEARAFDHLRHPLAAEYTRRRIKRVLHPNRSRWEARVVSRAGPAACQQLRDSGLVASLLSVSGSYGASFAHLRDVALQTARDSEGSLIEFPGPETVRDQMEKMSAFILANWLAHPVFTALSIIPLILNTHPLINGNGRVSRIAAFALLRHGSSSINFWAPLYDYNILSGGSLDLAIRTAEIRGDWNQYFEFTSRLLQTTPYEPRTS